MNAAFSERTPGEATYGPQATLLSKADLAKFLGITTRTVEAYQRKGLPFYRLGQRRNRYDLAAVRAWLDRRCQGRFDAT